MTAQEFIAEANAIAKSHGFITDRNESDTTHSHYLTIGRRSEHGGIKTMIEVRVSDHSKYGTPSGLHVGKNYPIARLHVRSSHSKAKKKQYLSKLDDFLCSAS